MNEYISRETTIDAIKKIYCPQCNNYNGVMCRACEHMDDMEIIEDMPATDVQHGRWEQIGEQSAKCAACGGVLRSNGIDKTGKALIFNAVYHYCPFCGARMDGNDK